jgi:hypothetical protein
VEAVRPRPTAAGAGADPSGAEYWRAVKGGDFIALRDAQSFESRLAGGGDSSAEFAVGQVRRFALLGRERLAAGPGRAAPRPDGEYRFIELQREGSGPLYLTLIQSEENFALRLYFIPSGMTCGTRDELIDAGQTWLFLPPPDPEDFLSSQLEYAPYPDVPEIKEAGLSEGQFLTRKFIFSPLGPGKSLYAMADDTGAPAIITEYQGEAPPGEEAPANPLLLVLEEGWMREDGTLPDEGGYLTPMLGAPIRPEDLELFPA